MKENDNAALEKLFLEYYYEWCFLSYTYLQNMVEAEEVVQDIFVQVLVRSRHTEILNLKAYIIKAIKNKSLKSLRRLRKHESLKNMDHSICSSSEEDIIFKENEVHLQRVLASLPDSCKKVFEICVIEGQKYQTAAETLGISVNTVKYHVKKAYKTLRMEMEDVYFLISIFAISLLSGIFF